MTLNVNIEALQNYVVEQRTIALITNVIKEIFDKSDLFSSTFVIERLKFGTKQPLIQLLSLKDVDVTLQWHLNTHEVNIPSLKKSQFEAPFQAVIAANIASDCSMIFKAELSYDGIAPGAIKYPIRASLTDIGFTGRLTAQYLGDSLIVFFETPPEFNFSLELALGLNETLFDNDQVVKNFICEVLHDWVNKNLVHPNALKFPFNANEDV